MSQIGEKAICFISLPQPPQGGTEERQARSHLAAAESPSPRNTKQGRRGGFATVTCHTDETFHPDFPCGATEGNGEAVFLNSLKVAAAAAAKSLQSCPTLCDPIDGSPPGSPSLGFSRLEHWSGLPFPSPVHESEN